MARDYNHFSLSQRIVILQAVIGHQSMRAIGRKLDKSPSAISEEIKRHRIFIEHNPLTSSDTRCRHYLTCTKRRRSCMAASACANYLPEPLCQRLARAPWVCDGCAKKVHCRKSHYAYKPELADQQAKKALVESRRGPAISQQAIQRIDNILVNGLKDHNQSIAHIEHSNQLGISRSTLYRYIDAGRFSIVALDLPMKVRYKNREAKKVDEIRPKTTQARKKGRHYADYLAYVESHQNASICQIDSVIGTVGSSVLLTLMLTKSNFMMAFKRPANNAQSVIDIWNHLQDKLSVSEFMNLFSVILGDCGSEFTQPLQLETLKKSRVLKCHFFYCDPMSPHQKGGLERNHEFIRRFVPQGQSFDSLSQRDIDIMMNQINSIRRDHLNGKSPFEALSKPQARAARKLGYRPVSPDSVNLSMDLFKKNKSK